MNISLGVLLEVGLERNRQDAKWGEQNHPDVVFGLGPFLPTADFARERCDKRHAAGKGSWLDILVEEVCEAAEETHDPAALRTELIQVAAVAVAWVEAIDRRAS